jgi:group I intron endonuclease|nr:MAG TPA: intron associated endonuclease [Caudoviricetes sp.]
MRIVGIYKITNTVDGKIYIGQTVNYEKRKRSHRSYLLNNKHCNSHLQRAFNKYGLDSFKIELIQECKIDELDDLEKFYIKKYNCCNEKSGYNMMYGGQKYRKFTPEVLEKMSRARKGKKLSEEHKRKISLANKNKVISKEAIEKMKLAKKLNPTGIGEDNFNAVISDDVAEKIIDDLILNKTVKELEIKYSVTPDIIYNLMYNKSYKHIKPEIRESLSERTKINMSSKIEKAIDLYLNGMSQNEISKTLKMSRNTLRRELKKRDIKTDFHVNQFINNANTELSN